MGNRNCHTDNVKTQLLNDTDDVDLPTENLIFKDIGIVLMGHDGKNRAANYILGQKEFTFWDKYVSRRHRLAETEICDQNIRLVYTAGSYNHLSVTQDKIKDDTVHCIRTLLDPGPHVIIFVIQIGARYSILKEKILKPFPELFTDKVWDHTMLLFTGGENLKHISIEDHILSNGFDDLVKKCKKRWYVVKKDIDTRKQFANYLDDFISQNNLAHLRLLPDRQIESGERNREITATKEELINKLMCYKLQKDNSSNKKKIKKLEDKIKKLEEIIAEKDLLLQQTGAEHKCVNCTQKDQQLKEQNEEIASLRQQIAKTRNMNMPEEGYHLCARSFINSVSQFQEECCAQSFEMTKLREWREVLCEILEDLNENEFKKFKFLIPVNKKGNLEKADTTDTADLMIKRWGEKESIEQTKLLMEKIPRNDIVTGKLKRFILMLD